MPKNKTFICFLLIATNISLLSAQQYTRYDKLKGQLSISRSCYDVTYYELGVELFLEEKSIKGDQTIYFVYNSIVDTIQFDLYSNFKITELKLNNSTIEFSRDSNHFFIAVPQTLVKNSKNELQVKYEGKPIEAKNAPWEGGFVWEKDSLGRRWVGIACQGIGASSWWPCKDHLSDKADSIRISIIYPDTNLQCVSNGVLEDERLLLNGHKKSTWFISNPIDNYNLTLNLGHFSHWNESFQSAHHALSLDFYVLDYNLKKAQTHFKQLHSLLSFFEKTYGPYPFLEDGFGVVETPYWGMEHQGAIAYGNNYKNNHFGFDFILVHESAHEYWGNSISITDPADLWINETFATYTESLFVEYLYGKGRSINYLLSQKKRIKNDGPLVGPYDVNYSNMMSTDIYYKGAWMLHSLRMKINNDRKWMQTLRQFYLTFQHKKITTEDVLTYFENQLSARNFMERWLWKESIPIELK